MLARVATFEFEGAERSATVLATVREAARDAVASVPGWRGVVQLLDPAGGRATVIHFLDDEAALDAAEATFATLDERVGEAARAALAELRRARRSVEVLAVGTHELAELAGRARG